MTYEPFTLSIETDSGTYQHGFHLGSDEAVARQIVQDSFRSMRPKIGRYVITMALMHKGKVVDVYDGTWHPALKPSRKPAA